MEFCAVLLHLNNIYELTGFEEAQAAALTALGSALPAQIGPYLCGQFYTPQVTMRARMLILMVIQAIAGTLSKLKITPPPEPEIEG